MLGHSVGKVGGFVVIDHRQNEHVAIISTRLRVMLVWQAQVSLSGKLSG